MPRGSLAIMLAGTLCWAGACEGGGKAPSEAEPSAVEAEKTKPVEPPAPKQTRTPAVIVDAEGSTPADDRPAPPAWFDAAKIEHVAVVNQMASQGTIAGGYASALVLELKPGATPQDCVDMARKVLGESLEDVPEATSADGRLMLQGEASESGVAYHYTVVCGDAKGKPTMYMSYTAK